MLTEEWAKQHTDVHFSSMHPGWADTPAVRTAMPDFHRQMSGKLRTEEEGADTIVWLAASDAALQCKSGQFFLGNMKYISTGGQSRTTLTEGWWWSSIRNFCFRELHSELHRGHVV